MYRLTIESNDARDIAHIAMLADIVIHGMDDDVFVYSDHAMAASTYLLDQLRSYLEADNKLIVSDAVEPHIEFLERWLRDIRQLCIKK